MDKRKELYDIHSLDPTGCEISNRANKHFFQTIMSNGILRERLALAEGISGHQTQAMSMLFGRDDGSIKELPEQRHLDMQEKIMAEKKRMVTG